MAELLDAGGDSDGIDVVKLAPMFLEPNKKPRMATGPRIRGRSVPRPCVEPSLAPLEDHFQSHLDQPRRPRPADQAEVAVGHRAVGIAELCVVEGVEHLRPELNVRALGDVEVLLDADAKLFRPGPLIGARSELPKKPCSVFSKQPVSMNWKLLRMLALLRSPTQERFGR